VFVWCLSLIMSGEVFWIFFFFFFFFSLFCVVCCIAFDFVGGSDNIVCMRILCILSRHVEGGNFVVRLLWCCCFAFVC
jgi:hypothetical protein